MNDAAGSPPTNPGRAAASIDGRGFDAIVIGTSAGGVQALGTLLPALPAGLGAAVFVVVHLPRERKSLLPSVFGPRCRLPVREAQDKEPVEAGTVYIAPPDYHLLVDEGPTLALSADPAVHFSRPSIDALLGSAVDVYGDRLLAILLTGANHDGAAGLQLVHAAGGMTIVQDPATAQVPQMPEAALALGAPDRLLPLAAIAELLGRLGPHMADNLPQ